MMRIFGSSLFFLLLTPVIAFAAKPDVVGVAVKARANGLYQFDVTISHDDKGWEHYVDKWEVLDSDGKLIAQRTLFHPHTDEQPFTRSLVGVKIPGSVKQVTIRAHDSVYGYGGKTMTVNIP